MLLSQVFEAAMGLLDIAHYRERELLSLHSLQE